MNLTTARRTFALAEVKQLDGEGPGEFEAILSVPVLDRDGEVIDPRAFDPLPARIPVHADHAITTTGVVGSGVPWYDLDTLKIRGTLSALPGAQRIRQLIREGHLSGMSVGFITAQREDRDGVPHVTRAELIEASFVSIPANPQAAILAVKALEAEALRNPTDNDGDDARRLAFNVEQRARTLRFLSYL